MCCRIHATGSHIRFVIVLCFPYSLAPSVLLSPGNISLPSLFPALPCAPPMAPCRAMAPPCLPMAAPCPPHSLSPPPPCQSPRACNAGPSSGCRLAGSGGRGRPAGSFLQLIELHSHRHRHRHRPPQSALPSQLAPSVSQNAQERVPRQIVSVRGGVPRRSSVSCHKTYTMMNCTDLTVCTIDREREGERGRERERGKGGAREGEREER